MNWTVHTGNCLDVLREMPGNSVDSVVTDPPYGLAFMGKRWDYDVPSVEIWRECLRVLKPGGHLLAFAGTRTQHRMAVRIEDAGFEIRDMIAWVYGSGFPKSLDVSKAIDKIDAAEARLERQLRFTAWMRSTGLTAKQIDEITGTCMGGHYTAAKSQPAVATREHLESLRPHIPCDVPAWVELLVDERTVESETFKRREVVRSVEMRDTSSVRIAVSESAAGYDAAARRCVPITAPATEAARQWSGWGTALKPALETVTVASKPFPFGDECAMLDAGLAQLEARLWLMLNARTAEQRSESSQSVFAAACATAQWTAGEITSTRGALCAQMGMSQFELATSMSLNTVLSWRRTLADLWTRESTSTTETASSMTTGLRTLRFCLSKITPESIIRESSQAGGYSANACTAGKHLNAWLASFESTQTLSATEHAMSLEAESYRDGGVKPSLEPCIMARKQLAGTVAATVLEWGTGAINVDGCRVGTEKMPPQSRGVSKIGTFEGADGNFTPERTGRWPANLIHDNGSEATALLGEAARFFYHAKASKADRDDGCETLPQRTAAERGDREADSAGMNSPRAGAGRTSGSRNHHPTVKPTDLMRYLCRLVTPPGGTVLDPFTGSGSTGRGAVLEGFSFIGAEMDPEYAEIARARISAAAMRSEEDATQSRQLDLFGDA